MNTVSVQQLKKHFYIHKRSSGVIPALASIFRRKQDVVQAVNDISFTIEQGELVGFIGPNGAGKTTTLKCLSGLLYPSSGQIKVLGHVPYDRKKEFLKKISLVMGQKNQLWWDLPALDTFTLNKEIYELKDAEFKKTLDELTGLLEVEDLLSVPVRHLSLGQRMKMELIASLIHKPQVLFLDEPTIGLDVVMQKKMREFIANYNKIHHSTILLTSHYMADVKQLCQRVIIIDHGKIIYDGEISSLIRQYADTKFITVEFADKITNEQLKKVNYLRSYNYPKAQFSIPRDKTIKFIAKIMKKFAVDDLIIEEPDIEEVVRIVFAKGNP